MSVAKGGNEFVYQEQATLGIGQKWPLLHRPTADRAILFALDPDLATRVNARLETAHRAAKRIVARQRAAIEYLAALLLNHRALEGDALDRILAEIAERFKE